MTEEEKKAMIHIKEFLYKDRGFITADECEIFFNYISKLEKANKILNKSLAVANKLEKELENKE